MSDGGPDGRVPAGDRSSARKNSPELGSPDRSSIDRDSFNPLPVDVVSIQSQVVYGCVGNTVAVPTMQALGLNVISLPTVLLSNVPHYDTLHGGPVSTAWFEGFLADVERRRVLESARAILLGYLGPPEQTAVLVAWLERVLASHPQIQLLLDPVIGDHDVGIYVHAELPGLLRERLVPMSHGLTPNSFELEQLVGKRLTTLDETIAAARQLLSSTTEWIVVTSAAPAETSAGETSVLIVTADDTRVITHRLVETVAKGAGDLFTASLVGRLLLGDSLYEAAQFACDKTEAVMTHTTELGCAELVLNQRR